MQSGRKAILTTFSSDLRFALSVDPRILGRAKRRSVFRLQIAIFKDFINVYTLSCMIGQLSFGSKSSNISYRNIGKLPYQYITKPTRYSSTLKISFISSCYSIIRIQQFFTKSTSLCTWNILFSIRDELIVL